VPVISSTASAPFLAHSTCHPRLRSSAPAT